MTSKSNNAKVHQSSCSRPNSARDAVLNASTKSDCDVTAEVKRRTGRPKWWCKTHGAPAWDKNGERLAQCHGVVENSQTEDALELNLDDYPGGVALWGALPPIYDTAGKPYDWGVHVHARKTPGGKKVIDRSFAAVRVTGGGLHSEVVVGEAEAVSYVASALFGKAVKTLLCSHCGHPHLDMDRFAVHPHRKHLCHRCGREFFDPAGEKSIGNPLMGIKESLGDAGLQREVVAVERRLVLRQDEVPGGFQLWPSNPAILWTASKREEEGVHVHAYDEQGRRVVDDTYGHVEIDGTVVDAECARYFMGQGVLPYLEGRIRCLVCPECGNEHFDKGDWALTPHYEHDCEKCGHAFRARLRKKLVSNPFVKVQAALLAAKKNRRAL